MRLIRFEFAPPARTAAQDQERLLAAGSARSI
jgi:hypothetical protein